MDVSEDVQAWAHAPELAQEVGAAEREVTMVFGGAVGYENIGFRRDFTEPRLGGWCVLKSADDCVSFNIAEGACSTYAKLSGPQVGTSGTPKMLMLRPLTSWTVSPLSKYKRPSRSTLAPFFLSSTVRERSSNQES